jgi:hypothetical protein
VESGPIFQIYEDTLVDTLWTCKHLVRNVAPPGGELASDDPRIVSTVPMFSLIRVEILGAVFLNEGKSWQATLRSRYCGDDDPAGVNDRFLFAQFSGSYTQLCRELQGSLVELWDNLPPAWRLSSPQSLRVEAKGLNAFCSALDQAGYSVTLMTPDPPVRLDREVDDWERLAALVGPGNA